MDKWRYSLRAQTTKQIFANLGDGHWRDIVSAPIQNVTAWCSSFFLKTKTITLWFVKTVCSSVVNRICHTLFITFICLKNICLHYYLMVHYRLLKLKLIKPVKARCSAEKSNAYATLMNGTSLPSPPAPCWVETFKWDTKHLLLHPTLTPCRAVCAGTVSGWPQLLRGPSGGAGGLQVGHGVQHWLEH